MLQHRDRLFILPRAGERFAVFDGDDRALWRQLIRLCQFLQRTGLLLRLQHDPKVHVGGRHAGVEFNRCGKRGARIGPVLLLGRRASPVRRATLRF